MMKRWILLAMLAGSSAMLLADTPQVTFQQLTVPATAVQISSSTLRPTGTGAAVNIAACNARLETAEIRYTWDGTTPTSTVGTLLEVGEVLVMPSLGVASAMQFIRTTTTSGKLDVSCWTSNP